MYQHLKNINNPFRAIWEQMPKKADLDKMQPNDFGNFFDFLDFFYEDAKIKVTAEKIVAMEEMLSQDPKHPFWEFYSRVGREYDPEDSKIHQRFYIRLASLMRLTIQHAKKNPTCLSVEVIAKIKDKPQYSWCLDWFKEVPTKIGGSVIEHDDAAFRGNEATTLQPVSYEKTILEATLKMADLYNEIAGSISKNDIKKMLPKDKIAALQKLSQSLTIIKNFKPNATVFQQINVFKAGREELEAAILDIPSGND